MFLKIGIFVLATLCLQFACGVYVYSSFWAPLFNPRILNYRVDLKFEPDAGKNNRGLYEKMYGYRGENLIADLGNGKGPASYQNKDQNNEEVKFYYTYPGAEHENEVK